MRLCAENLRCEFLTDPLGVGADTPLLSWTLRAQGWGSAQAAYQICVASEPELLDAPDLWDSGRLEGSDSRARYAGRPLRSDEAAYWRVRAWDASGEVGDWSKVALWRRGVRKDDWRAEWIGWDEGRDLYDPSLPYYCADDFDKGESAPFLPKPAMLRSEFAAGGDVRSATLYLSAMGLAEVWLNGERAVTGHLIPGCCDYRRRVYYRAYDVTSFIREGQNAVSAALADGWYAGYIGLNPRQWWGAKPRLSAQIHIRYADGRAQIVETSANWRAATGPYLYADTLHGSGYDATLEPDGWRLPGFDDANWHPALTGAEYDHIPEAHPGPPIEEYARWDAVDIRRINDDEAMLDMGCCFAGVLRLTLRGARGARIEIQHAEQLTMDGGELYLRGNRSARQLDRYVLSGAGEEVFQPEFTYHGFRYAHIRGLRNVELLRAEGVAISAALPSPTLLDSGNETVRGAIQLIRNTLLSNMMDMPTDVCARDERLGWGAEGHFFMHTASALCDCAAFLRKWLRDILDGQLENGSMWAIAPAVMMKDINPFAGDLHSDLGLHCAWLLWRNYRDADAVGASFPALERYFEYSLRNSDRLLRFATSRDWLDLCHDGHSDFDHGFGALDPTLLGTAWFACSARMMADIAEGLGKGERAEYYRGMYAKIRAAFRTFFLRRDKLLRGCTQGGYMLAAAFDLIEGEEIEAARDWVLEDMRRRDGGISFGTGSAAVAFAGMRKLGLQKEAAAFWRRRAFPSFGYMIDCGATAVWERWDSIRDGEYHPHAMNAFDHIGMAEVGEWLLTGLAGIEPELGGYDEVRLAPVFDAKIGSMRARYESVHGAISAEWKFEDGGIRYAVELPVGACGDLLLPCPESAIRILRGEEGVTQRSGDGKTANLRLAPGSYEFRIEL